MQKQIFICNVFFPPQFCKNHTAAYTVSRNLLTFSGMVTNNPHYTLTQICGTAPKGGAIVKNLILAYFSSPD